MPTYELIGKGVNGRPDTLRITAERKADAVAEGQALGFTISDVRELTPGSQTPLQLTERHVAAMELIAASRIIRKPVSTIGWGVVVSGFFLLVIGLALALAMFSAGAIAERAQNAANQPPPGYKGRMTP